jgi:hypothetical protein
MGLAQMLESFWLLKCHTFCRPNLASTQERVVLKITITDLPDEEKWSLQGLLVGHWAAELKSRWREVHHVKNTRRCIVELIEVTSIDRNGEAVLAEIMGDGAQFIASDVYTKHLLRNLRGELTRSRMTDKEGDDEVP